MFTSSICTFAHLKPQIYLCIFEIYIAFQMYLYFKFILQCLEKYIYEALENELKTFSNKETII